MLIQFPPQGLSAEAGAGGVDLSVGRIAAFEFSAASGNEVDQDGNATDLVAINSPGSVASGITNLGNGRSMRQASSQRFDQGAADAAFAFGTGDDFTIAVAMRMIGTSSSLGIVADLHQGMEGRNRSSDGLVRSLNWTGSVETQVICTSNWPTDNSIGALVMSHSRGEAKSYIHRNGVKIGEVAVTMADFSAGLRLLIGGNEGGARLIDVDVFRAWVYGVCFSEEQHEAFYNEGAFAAYA